MFLLVSLPASPKKGYHQRKARPHDSFLGISQDVERAARLANAAEFIKSLPEGCGPGGGRRAPASIERHRINLDNSP